MSYDLFRKEPENQLLVGEQPLFGANVWIGQSQLGSNIEKNALGETAVDFFDNDFFGVPASVGLTAAITVTLDDVAPTFAADLRSSAAAAVTLADVAPAIGAQLASGATVAVALADATVSITGSLGAAGLTAAVQVQLADVAPAVAAQIASAAAVAVTLDSIGVAIAADNPDGVGTQPEPHFWGWYAPRYIEDDEVVAKVRVTLDGVVPLVDAQISNQATAALVLDGVGAAIQAGRAAPALVLAALDGVAVSTSAALTGRARARRDEEWLLRKAA